MTHALTVILAIAAAQAAEPASTPAAAEHAPAAKARTVPAAQPAAPAPAPSVLPEAYRRVREGAPALRWGAPSRCLERAGTYYRVQCDDEARRCLVAPDAELDEYGNGVAQLERAPACAGPPITETDLVSRGYAVVLALAEAPPGWYRDERQRAMQVDFDLNARFFLGGGYLAASGGPWDGGFTVAAGGRLDRPFTWWGAPALARMHFLEGWASADGKRGDLVVFGIDASRVYPTPLLRITTFFGKPRRFDPPLYFGLWAEGLRFEMVRTRGDKEFDRAMPIAGAVTVDLWRSRDLSDFVRLRAGAGYEEANGGDWASWVPLGAVEGEVTLGENGFHHLRAMALGELPGGSQSGLPAVLPEHRSRVTLKAEYELILFAVDNQPVSLALEAKAQRRNDVPDYPRDWIAQGEAQLRFSLWAPPRRDAKVQGGL